MPIIKRPELYYSAAQSSVQYSWTPSGILIVERLIKHQSYWIAPTLLRIVKQKSLILADWTSKGWSSEKTEEVNVALNKLMELGFVIYIWLAGKVFPVHRDELLILRSYFKDMTIASPQEITRAAVIQNKLTSEQVLVLDDYWLSQILSTKEELEPRTLRISELSVLRPEQVDALRSILNASTPKLTKIIHDEFSEESNQYAKHLKQHWADIPIEEDYTAVTLDSNQRDDTFQTITLDECELNRAHLEKIQVIAFGQDTSISYLKDVLSATPKLKVLAFLKSFNLSTNSQLMLGANGMENLECIQLCGDNISGKNLQVILQAAPKLKTLYLRSCDLLNDTFSLDGSCLGQLENFMLFKSDIAVKNLQAILQTAPNLKVLSLISCDQLSDARVAFADRTMSQLEIIALSSSNILQDSLQAILQAAPNLKILDLRDCKQLNTGRLALTQNALRSLATIDLSHSTISGESLQVILQAAPNLKTLNVANCNEVSDFGWVFANMTMGELQSIDLSSSNISQDSLQAILQAAPNLKTLNVANCNHLNDVRGVFANMTMGKLESIDLSSSNISQDSLQAILQAAPNLKTLNVANCNHLNDVRGMFADMIMGELESIDLSRSNISQDSLQAILQAAPNLKTLKLNNCEHLSHDTFVLAEGSLNKLESIECYGGNISVKNLQAILQAAPNLNESSKKQIEQRINYQIRGVASVISGQDAELQRPFQSSEPSVNPAHDPKKMKDYQPSKTPFQFKGQNKTKNQGMIIEKLCQYWTLESEPNHTALIPKIQDGICESLSYYFLSLTKDDWGNFIQMASEWDGRSIPDKKLIDHFRVLHGFVQTYQLNPQPKAHYLGDALNAFLEITEISSYILSNPWHTIAIDRTDDGNWLVYDPNYVTGCMKVGQADLLKTIHHSIGSIVKVQAQTTVEPSITDPNKFIAEGGFLALCSCKNAQAMLSKLPQDHQYSKEALDGLLLRDTSGRPAWTIGLSSKSEAIKSFTRDLQRQFELLNEADAVTQLTKSLEALTPAQQGECITTIVQASKEGTRTATATPRVSLETQLVMSLRKASNKKNYEKKLKTWDKTAEHVTGVFHYSHLCLMTGIQKRLIELDSSQQVDSLRLQLEQRVTNTGRPVFYVDKPDDLICSTPWIRRNVDNTGTLCRGPGGPLYEFLQANKDERPVLIVNYERFNADDLIRFNGLLDKYPNADGTALPEHIQIIGLMNRNKPDCYQGSDFYSRFNRTEHCPLTKQQLEAIQPTRIVERTSQTSAETTRINLYHAADWEDRLLGRWVMNGDTLTFQEGALTEAIRAGKAIEIQNGNWDDPTFARFWEQALAGSVGHGERAIHIPAGIKLTRPETEAYQWDIRPVIKEGLPDSQDVNVLNSTCLGRFLGYYDVENDRLVKKDGLIQQCSGQECIVYVTRTLSDDEWAIVLDECKKYDVTLHVYSAPGVTCPAAFNQPSVTKPVSHRQALENITDGLIISTDIDTSVAMLIKNDPSYVVIDVSECTPSDLLVKLNGQLNEASMRFEFSQSESALTRALAEGKKIILKGSFSPELMDSLAPLLLNESIRQQLLLVTNDIETGAFISNRYSHTVTTDEKRVCLSSGSDEEIMARLGGYLASEPLSILRVRYKYLKSNPTANATDSDRAWLGMSNLPGGMQAFTATRSERSSEIESMLFIKSRIAKVNAVLDSEPFVFLTGLSGVGKSTFVEKELCKQDALYLTEDRIETWATDTTDKRKILFIDEANLCPRQWSEFEGLYNTPSTVLVNGTLHTLSPYHKVVFAGNPTNYGDERTLAPFFKRHGNAVLFTPLPPAVIYEKILKPVFKDTEIELDSIAERILNVYRFVCECSTTDMLISPRELQMMALLTIIRAQKNPEQNHADIAAHFTYALAKNLVPKSKRAAFDKAFKPTSALFLREEGTASQEGPFLITESRRVLSQQIDDLLVLRNWRRDNESRLNAAQKEGGLGGIIIEGEPGIGKSELVIAALRARGYEEEHHRIDPTTKSNLFYRMPVSMPLSEKEALLIKAFNEGAVVVIDEINSSPMMERLLNDLLMGKNPRSKEDDKIKPGFMVIATQNPVTMAGRRAASTAFLRRCISDELPEFQHSELYDILTFKGVSADEAEAMISAYQANRAYAIRNHLSPVPNCRDLIELADDYLNQKNAVAIVASGQDALTIQAFGRFFRESSRHHYGERKKLSKACRFNAE